MGGFYGETELESTLTDILRFRKAIETLYNDLKGSAEFTTIDNQVRIKIEADGLGHMNASGELFDHVGLGNRLSFVIDFDQTLLKRTISEIDEAVSMLKKMDKG